MELKPFVFLALVGCGGAPFEFARVDAIGRSEDAGDAANAEADAGRADAPEGEPADAPPTPDAPLDVAHPDAGHPLDAGRDVEVDADVGVDAEVDAGVEAPPDSPPDAPPDVAVPPVDAATTCTPIVQTAFTCGGQAISSPYQFCAYNLGTGVGGALAMPAACQCAETFTCACLLMGESPCGGLVYHGCVVDPGFQLTVTCS